MNTDRRNMGNVRFLVMSTSTRAMGLAIAIGLCATVPAHAQADPAGYERLLSGQQISGTTSESNFQDCNANGVPDECDIADGTSVDCNFNGLPDECELDRRFPAHIIADGGNSIFAADLDGDGDIDVLSASARDDKIAWFENTDGVGTFGPQRIILNYTHRASSVLGADFDGDGDIDVLWASDVKTGWHQNTDGLGTFGERQVIATAAGNLRIILAADFDGDGDIDALSASSYPGKIAWYENIDGLGAFGPQLVITTAAAESIVSVFAADLDGDGDIDILSAFNRDLPPHHSTIVWYENTDSHGSFGPEQVITTGTHDVLSVFAADLDGDGDTDFLASFGETGRIAWYENTNGLGAFILHQVTSATRHKFRYR